MPYSSHPLWPDHPNDIMQPPPLPFTSSFSAPSIALSTFPNNRYNCSSVHLNTCVSVQQAGTPTILDPMVTSIQEYNLLVISLQMQYRFVHVLPKYADFPTTLCGNFVLHSVHGTRTHNWYRMIAGEKAEQKTWPLERYLATELHTVTSQAIVIRLFFTCPSTARNTAHGNTGQWLVEWQTLSVQYRGLVCTCHTPQGELV